MQGKIITISRQCGSGGHSIGNELAKRLDVPFYDKEIIEMTAKESGFHPQFVEEKGGAYGKQYALQPGKASVLCGAGKL